MTEAYVMIICGADTSPTLVQSIEDLPQVERADVVAGEFDIIALVEADSPRELLTLVTERIHPLEGVGNTRTAIVLG